VVRVSVSPNSQWKDEGQILSCTWRPSSRTVRRKGSAFVEKMVSF